MIFRRYKCYDCGFEDDRVFKSKAPPAVACDNCEGDMKRMLCSNFYVDGWTPMTNNAQADVDHFNKKKVVNGKFRSKKCAYAEDKAKKDIPVNIAEV